MDDTMTTEAAPPAPRRGLAGWLREGARGLAFQPADWRGLAATPRFVALLVLAGGALEMSAERLLIAGEARFYWRAAIYGWFGIAALAWLCWLVVPRARGGTDARAGAPDAGTLLALLCVQGVLATPATTLLAWALERAGALGPDARSELQVLLLAWAVAIQASQLWHAAPAAGRGARVFAVLALAGVAAVIAEAAPLQFWYPAPSTSEDARTLHLTQELMESQPRLLAAALDGLAPQRPGAVDLYAITFAPYASEDVFMRESAMVADVMATRFDARGRVVQLVNNDATAATMPWATALNLHRAIDVAARRMDRDEDVLFIHVTSHGGADGHLAMDFEPMTLDTVTPQALKSWLDAAGVRWRVISISACYSGGWVAPLAGDGTLVMTAADADHTSYGCGSRSPLTFFGQAMYDEELRRDTRSFERAHAAARRLIEQREGAAGKKDGYSNPQISEGAAIRGQLAKLEAQLAAREALAGRK